MKPLDATLGLGADGAQVSLGELLAVRGRRPGRSPCSRTVGRLRGLGDQLGERLVERLVAQVLENLKEQLARSSVRSPTPRPASANGEGGLGPRQEPDGLRVGLGERAVLGEGGLRNAVRTAGLWLFDMDPSGSRRGCVGTPILRPGRTTSVRPTPSSVRLEKRRAPCADPGGPHRCPARARGVVLTTPVRRRRVPHPDRSAGRSGHPLHPAPSTAGYCRDVPFDSQRGPAVGQDGRDRP